MALSKVNTDSLVSVADAIRAKGGTSAPLSFPFGFVSAINDIETGGGGTGAEDGIIDRTIGGEYTNSRVSTAGTYAFAYCSALTTLNLPNVTILGNRAVYNCIGLTAISIPNATSIGSATFAYCSALTTLNLPNVVNTGDEAFAYCSALTTVSAPLLRGVRSSAFSNCINLTTAIFPHANEVGNYAFAQCENLSTISCPSATLIGNSAFTSCSALTTAKLLGAAQLGQYAFNSCYRLLSLYLFHSRRATIYSGTFKSTPIAGYTDYTNGVYGSVFVPASLYDAYCSAQHWSSISARIVSLTDAEIEALQ